MSVAFGLNRLDMTSVAGFAASAQRAETAGWRYGFIPSSPLLARDPYVMIANALAQTQSITLGPLIENPSRGIRRSLRGPSRRWRSSRPGG